MPQPAVPFRLLEYWTSSLNRVITTHGILRMEEDALVFEYRETSTNLNTLRETRGQIEIVRLGLEHVESIDVGRRWPWGAKLRIRANTLRPLPNLRGVSNNEIVVRVRRRDHDRARELCINATLAMSTRELRQLGEGQGM